MTLRLVLCLLLIFALAGCSKGEVTPLCASGKCNGCCDSDGICQGGKTAQACGGGGRACDVCTGGKVCFEGACNSECKTTCPGCCNALGVCTQSSNAACGLSGTDCTECKDGTSCQSGRCLPGGGGCGPSSCGGCCRGNDCVEPGNAADGCGSKGGQCDICEDGEQCLGGSCQEDPCADCESTDQCCYEGKCFPGDTFGLCGKPGQQCVGCEVGQICFNRECVKSNCDDELCKKGCCKDNACHLPGPSDPKACGTEGRDCEECKTGKVCKNGSCTTPPKVCPPDCVGCCDDFGDCVDGTDDDACGASGDCAKCGSNQDCVGQKCTCTKTSCADGCCDGDACKAGDQNDGCGAGGETCEECTGTASCSGGSCGTTCDAKICPNGCCVGDVCNKGGASDPTNCGTGGKQCDPCDTGAGEQCVDGGCNDPTSCGPSSAANPCTGGCCLSNFCQAGTAADACGLDGDTCAECPTWAICQSTAAARFCDASPSSRWRVSLAEVVLDDTIIWDNTGAPDIFVELSVGGQTRTSSTYNNAYTAQFDEYLLTATGADLKAQFSYVIYDDDPWPVPNTEILTCSDIIYADEFAQGYAQINFPCGNAMANPVKSIRFTLTLE